MKKGTIVTLPPSISFAIALHTAGEHLQCREEWCDLLEGENYVILKDLPLTTTDMGEWLVSTEKRFASVTDVVLTITDFAGDADQYYDARNKMNYDLNTYGKIDGFVLMSIPNMQKFWISKYDIKHFVVKPN